MAAEELNPTQSKPLRGWALVGTNKWWPAMFGTPPPVSGYQWEEIR